MNFNTKAFWHDILEQNEAAIRMYFHDNAYVNWHCTDEHFTVDEFIRANCEYPGEWAGEIEREERTGDLVITAVHVYARDNSSSFHAVSFIKLKDEKIVSVDEYWGDDGLPPQWRIDKKIGTSIEKEKMSDWFTIDKIDSETYIISEYRHWEETHAYLLNGTERSMLIDTGLGIRNIYDEVTRLTDKPVTAVATHIHWDHIGGHRYFPDFYAHEEELNWLNGEFPLSDEVIKKMVTDRCDLPEDFDINKYELFQGTPTKVLRDNDKIDIGGRVIEVLHTPGHSPGHMCFWESGRGYLFTGDLVYKDTLFAYYPSTDPAAYLASLKKIAALPAKKVFPAHHSLDIQPEIVVRMRDELQKLQDTGKLCHDSGTYDYGDWAIWL